mmetsp:Transcript_3499/g.5746  ORF Transcript_3499/g.5746 Transcript_3499/m.5746 type:complete len:220 (-) Transcript_3499:123-782(-)
MLPLMNRSMLGKSSSPSKPRSSRGAGRWPFLVGGALGSGRMIEMRRPRCFCSSGSSVSPTSCPRPQARETLPPSSPSVTTSSVRNSRASCSSTVESGGSRVSRHVFGPEHAPCSDFCVETFHTLGSALGLTQAVTVYAEETALEGSCCGFLNPDASSISGCVRRTRPNFSTSDLLEGNIASQSTTPALMRPRMLARLCMRMGSTRYGRGRCCPTCGIPE